MKKPKIRIITRYKGPIAYGQRPGVTGKMRIYSEGIYQNETLLEIVVDADFDGNPESWGVVAIMTPLGENGVTIFNSAAYIFGDGNRKPFEGFQDALSFALSLHTVLDDQDIDTGGFQALIDTRAMGTITWTLEDLDEDGHLTPEGAARLGLSEATQEVDEDEDFDPDAEEFKAAYDWYTSLKKTQPRTIH